ncbi:MAG: hypothetical protein N2035_05160 [Chthoniobacterales bacterium]|nr:hypothetical protein [Chthoniobacterales bacterium]
MDLMFYTFKVLMVLNSLRDANLWRFRLLARVFLAVFLLILGGCIYEVAPTPPSRNINTWLLGRWEYKTQDGKTLTATLEPSSSSRYRLKIEERDSRGRVGEPKQHRAWISRIGGVKFLTVELTQANEKPKYLLLAYQLLSPNRLRVIVVNVEHKNKSSYSLRKAIRAAIRKGTLFSETGMVWQKTGEIAKKLNEKDMYEVFEPTRVQPTPSSLTE